jgi:acetyl esterase
MVQTRSVDLPEGLDAQLRPILQMIAMSNPVSLREATVEEARLALERGVVLDKPVPDGVAIRNDRIHLAGRTIPVRVFTPSPSGRGAVLFMHGGGFVLGSLDTHHALCGRLAAMSGATVVSVGYRLAPEHPFPAAVDDALAALDWVRDRAEDLGGDGGLVVAGDSAGGNLAAVIAQQSRLRPGPALRLQVLMYPVTDLTAGAKHRPSVRENASGLFLTLDDMRWFDEQYQADVGSPLASPAVAESFAGLPPALVITAEFDPLRDDGEHYAELLRAAGVDVRLRRYPGQIHGFMSMSAFVAAADSAMHEVASAVRDAVG